MSKEDKIDIVVKKKVVEKRTKLPNYTEEIEGQREDGQDRLPDNEETDPSVSSEGMPEGEDENRPNLEEGDGDVHPVAGEDLENPNEGENVEGDEALEGDEESSPDSNNEEADPEGKAEEGSPEESTEGKPEEDSKDEGKDQGDDKQDKGKEEGSPEESTEGKPEEDSKDEGKDQGDDKQDKSKENESKGKDTPDKNKLEGLKGRKNLQPDRKGGDKKKKLPGFGKKDKDSPSAGDGPQAKIQQAKRLAMMVKAAIENTVNAIVNITNLLLNPIAWIALGIVLLMIIIIATASVVGQNDYNIMCDSSGVGSISISPDADDFTRQSAIASWFTSTPFALTGGTPLSKEQAAGIIGNMDKESYGANPKAIQGDSSLTQWATTTNQDILDWGTEGGKAIGIIQWDKERRVSLVNFAISEGTQWHDLNTQLKYLKSEMDSGYEREQLEAGGFNEPNKSVADYAKIWNVWFERSEESGTPDGDNPRIESAEAFASKYVGGEIGSLGTNCIGGSMGIDASNLVQLAIDSAWPNRSQALGRCVSLFNCGQYFSTDVYKQAKLAAEAATNKDSLTGLLASCDRFVATMFRATGQDPNFPWGNSSSQMEYMRDSADWAEVSCQDRQPGDVLWRDGHVMLYVGHVNGKDSIASASYMERAASLSSVSCQGDLFIGDGDTAIGYRKVK